MASNGMIVAAGIVLVLVGAAGAGAQGVTGPAEVSMDALMQEGADLYWRDCMRCHGDAGEGRPGFPDAVPKLHGQATHMTVERIARQVLRGGAYMPPFGHLDDREVAAIVTYVRNAFGNAYGPAGIEEIAAVRGR